MPKATPHPADTVEAKMSHDEVRRLSAMALRNRLLAEGDAFNLGGEEFVTGFVTIDTEQAVLTRILGALKAASEQGLEASTVLDVLTLFQGLTVELTAIILADVQYRGPADPDDPAAEAAIQAKWLRSRHGSHRVTTNRMIQLVISQLNLQEVGATLGKFLTGAGLGGLLVQLGLHLPQTPPPPSSSSGPVEPTA